MGVRLFNQKIRVIRVIFIVRFGTQRSVLRINERLRTEQTGGMLAEKTKCPKRVRAEEKCEIPTQERKIFRVEYLDGSLTIESRHT